MSCLVKAFVSVLLLQLIKKKKANALAVISIDFNIVVFLVTISLLQKLKLINFLYILITSGLQCMSGLGGTPSGC
jgi:hypothetical protein